MDMKGKIHFKNEEFMAIVEGKGNEPVKCVPIVYDGRDPDTAFGQECGAGILFEDGKKYFWGLYSPRDLITSWRATEVLRRLDVIKNCDFAAAYYTGRRKISNGDKKRYVEPIIAKIGNKTYEKIMAMPVPETIIRAIIDNQGDDLPPSLHPITDEVDAGTIKWREEFSRVGIKHPDEVKAEKRADKQIIARFERLLNSYASSRNLTRNGIGLAVVEGVLLELVKKGADKVHPDSLLVALAGANCDLSLSGSTRWLVSFIVGKPRFFRKRSHLAAVDDFSKMTEQLLSRLLEEYFPAEKPSPAPASV